MKNKVYLLITPDINSNTDYINIEVFSTKSKANKAKLQFWHDADEADLPFDPYIVEKEVK